MSNKSKVIKNVIWLLGEHGVRLSSALISTSILAKVLGVEGYGIYQYLLGLVTVFASLSYICGAEVTVPKLTTADSETRKLVMGNAFVIRLFFSSVAYILLLIFIFFTESKQGFYLIIILGLPIIFNEAFGIVTSYLQSQTMIRYRVVIMMFVFTLRMIIFVVFYNLGIVNIMVYTSILALEAVLIAACLCWVYYHLVNDTFFSFDWSCCVSLFRQGSPFFIGLVLMFVFLRLDLIMLRHLVDSTSLGLYASSLQLFNNITALAPMVAASFAPLYVYRHNEHSLIKRNVLMGSLLLCITAVIASLAIMKVSPILINLIFGEEFAGAVPIFIGLLFITPLYFLNEGLNLYLIKMQMGHKLIYKWLIVLSAAFVAYLIFIPRYGALGAVVGLGGAYFVSCLFGILVILRGSKIQKKDSFIE